LPENASLKVAESSQTRLGYVALEGRGEGMEEVSALLAQGVEVRADDAEGLFTPDEKKSLFDTVKLVNYRLADNVVGRMDITLTRLEYDMLMESVHLPNRFLKPEMIEVE
jgi:hypothetical protein